MSGTQRTIKSLAIALAAVIIVSIISACVGAGMILSHIFRGDDTDGPEWTEVVLEAGRDDVKELDIDLKTTNLKVERGENFEVIANEERVRVHRAGSIVYIEEEFGFLDSWREVGGEVRVILPEGAADLEKFMLDMGAGKAVVNDLVVGEMEMDLGAGTVELDGVRTTRWAKIDGGAGFLAIREADLRNLELEMGAGKVEIAGKLERTAKINAGVGKLDMNLVGGAEMYRMKVSKGVGSIRVNGSELEDGASWGNGTNYVDINGGVGAIEITTD